MFQDSIALRLILFRVPIIMLLGAGRLIGSLSGSTVMFGCSGS